ncbi:MerR family transcriptional regulator [Ectopseudomonas composti]|jgi:DNA-binding transcriptional MerR regulator|uniref:DNA-binding transcriptional regulator, MerR family n=1 Tax=Ectopseudomonas composti TaxID=658457 RepID=A0A1I5M0A1_9GAMM|nr:MerR family transcriptional regulator [Pseudomonas composti]MDN5514065.1 MerR family transcriptional regulator [Pseudomonas sp.]SFP02890.1 DNA-binding transcriptional regulator, MerR family [Pseudomonas composti]
MKIGELAQRSGLAASRIRFYESIGLLKLVERQANGYRSYPEQAVMVLNLITTAQQAGFSLEELRTLLPQDLSQWQHGKLLDTLHTKVRDIEALEQRLAQSKTHLLALIDEIESKPDDIDCATNAKRVLSKMNLGEPSEPLKRTGKTSNRA